MWWEFLFGWFLVSIVLAPAIGSFLGSRDKEDEEKQRTVPSGHGVYRMRDFFRF